MVAKPRIILVVDDEEDAVEAISRGLKARGYDVKAFDLASEASAYDSRSYDHAIIDIRMPEMSGFELARALWLDNPDLQVCFLSAFVIYNVEAQKAFPSLKSHCFLSKPISIAALAKHIEKHIASASIGT